MGGHKRVLSRITSSLLCFKRLTLAARLRPFKVGRGRSRKINCEPIKILQAKDDGVLDKCSSSGDTEKWWDSEHVLKRELGRMC